jgi:hypothetical protein
MAGHSFGISEICRLLAAWITPSASTAGRGHLFEIAFLLATVAVATTLEK